MRNRLKYLGLFIVSLAVCVGIGVKEVRADSPPVAFSVDNTSAQHVVDTSGNAVTVFACNNGPNNIVLSDQFGGPSLTIKPGNCGTVSSDDVQIDVTGSNVGHGYYMILSGS